MTGHVLAACNCGHQGYQRDLNPGWADLLGSELASSPVPDLIAACCPTGWLFQEVLRRQWRW